MLVAHFMASRFILEWYVAVATSTAFFLLFQQWKLCLCVCVIKLYTIYDWTESEGLHGRAFKYIVYEMSTEHIGLHCLEIDTMAIVYENPKSITQSFVFSALEPQQTSCNASLRLSVISRFWAETFDIERKISRATIIVIM